MALIVRVAIEHAECINGSKVHFGAAGIDQPGFLVTQESATQQVADTGGTLQSAGIAGFFVPA